MCVCVCLHSLFACVSEPLYIATLGHVYVCIFPIYLSNNMQLLHFPYAFSTYFEFNAKLNAPRATLHSVFVPCCVYVCASVCVSFLSSKIAAEAAFSSRVGKQFSSHCWDVRKVRLKVCNGYQLNCNRLVAHATLLSTLEEWNAKSKFIDHTHSHTHATRKGMQRKNELSLVKMEHCFISLPKVACVISQNGI